ncbi:hypothetical protein EJ06DRAFT_533158 [Trichodelitschia bisporula]|uniref:Zn(2)-C6 fungal-type domain-containing protein n=1 Tax=Trichodelitschia bisporula TaxID=703511 RepID=A0A6G1HP77_9PEZI|nr:hypothetical protein EJ06DRAFT_533158 [Trichodelitschia bisporula]
MAPTPPSTTSSSTGHSPDGQFRVVRKRNRIPLSCAPCRHRKLRCNRGHPCDNCTKRGDLDSCTYASPGQRKKGSPSSNSSGTPDEMQNRIDRLESLVLSLMTNGSQSTGRTAANAALDCVRTSSSISGSSSNYPLDVESIKEEIDSPETEGDEMDHVAKAIGFMKVDNNRNIFASEAHWYSILAEIVEVKAYFSEHKKQYEEQYSRMVERANERHSSFGTGLFFGVDRPTSAEEIRAAFPPKATTDKLIARFFNTYNYDPAFHVIHGPTYQKQYDQHWQNPGDTPIIWLAMTFTMIAIALQSYIRAGEGPPEFRDRTMQMLQDYRRLIAQCLQLANITSPINCMIETLILCLISEFACSRDAETTVLLGFSVVVRLAMKMGYHRDAKYYPIITPFQGEMRRRVWSVLRQADLLFSTQMGLPPMIRSTDMNSELPRNIYDDEIFEDMKALPPSRPMSEPTPMCYVIYKGQLISMLGRIVEAVQNLESPSYDVVMRLDQQLREVYTNIPPIFKIRSMDESLGDPAALVMQRYILDLLFHKSQLVLHRKFIATACGNLRHVYSRKACINSGLVILKHQSLLHSESRPGGRLHTVRWFVSSLTNHDFLLAAMVISIALYNAAEAERTGRRSSTATDPDCGKERCSEMAMALETAAKIWDSLRDESIEALKASYLLQSILTKLRRHEEQFYHTRQQQPQQAYPSGPTLTTSPPRFAPSVDESNVAPEHSAAMTLGMLSTGALSPNTGGLYTGFGSSDSVSQPQGPPLGSQFLGTGEGLASAPSPFSSLFGSGTGFFDAGLPSSGIDWDTLDSYIQTATVDNAGGGWPMNMDLGTPSGLPNQGQLSDELDPLDAAGRQQQQQQGGGGFMAGNVFSGMSVQPRSMPY